VPAAARDTADKLAKQDIGGKRTINLRPSNAPDKAVNRFRR
jgi:hypothetical protein